MKEDMSKYVWYARKRTIFGLPLSFTVYMLTSEKFLMRRGLFNLVEEEVRLYRVLDFTIKRSLRDRIFGLGKIVCQSADRSLPVLTVTGIQNVYEVKELFSKLVEEERARKNITSREFFDAGAGRE